MDPVPEGVYLLRNDLGLGGVFVEGDLDEMILAIRGDAQIVIFRAGDSEWALEFSPARSQTEFRTPDENFAYDLVPQPIVIVDGRIGSLGGGAVGPDGGIETSFEGDAPAVLDGVDLTIVSSDQVTIGSHLVLEGVRWRDGIPYAKGIEAQLVIYSAGRDVVTGEATGGGIVVAETAPAGLRLQASMTAASGGFSIEGPGRTVELLGALHADAYDGNGNTLSIFRDERAESGTFPANAPLTSEPQLAFYSLKVLSWREY
jgi:hypothetical protein